MVNSDSQFVGIFQQTGQHYLAGIKGQWWTFLPWRL